MFKRIALIAVPVLVVLGVAVAIAIPAFRGAGQALASQGDNNDSGGDRDS